MYYRGTGTPTALPVPFFFLPSACGTASEAASVSSLALMGIGVALDSDDLSAASGGWTDGEGSGLMEEDDGEVEDLASKGKRVSESDGRRSIIILLFFDPLAFDLLVDAGVVVDMATDGGVDDGWDEESERKGWCEAKPASCDRGHFITCVEPTEAWALVCLAG